MIDKKKIFSLTSSSFTFGVAEKDIKSKSRLTEVSDARKAVAYLLKKHLKMPIKHIASEVNRSEDQVGYLLRASESLLRLDIKFKNNVCAIEDGILGKCCPTCRRPM